MVSADFSMADATKMEDLTGLSGTKMFDRENGIRLITSVVAEISIHQRWNVWVVLEGAPFQSERAFYTKLLTGTMLDSDFGTYVRLGTSYKF